MHNGAPNKYWQRVQISRTQISAMGFCAIGYFTLGRAFWAGDCQPFRGCIVGGIWDTTPVAALPLCGANHKSASRGCAAV